MNKILAVFRKEYVETRTTTLVFWLFGVLFPLLKVFDVSVGTYADANPILLGGALAAWLNAAFLTASTFAREKEDGTFQTLRRVVPDWRVAVAGKGAWIIASTLILVAFFGAELFVAAKIDGESFLKGFRDVLNANSNKGDEGTLTTALVVSITSVCWGVFWTARSSRQMSAIFLSILSPLVANIVVAVFVASVNLIGSATDKSTLGATAWIVAILGLFALVAAPFPTRFGYRESEKKHAAAGKPDRRDASWNRIDVRKKGGSFPTLVSLAFADASLLVRSPVSALFELSILFFIVACAFAFEPFGLDASELSAALFVFYYSCFASGLFSDSKRKSSLVRERLGVKPREYWLANAFAALLMGAAVCGALVAIDRLGGWVDHSLFADDFKFAALSFLLFGILLWSASLKGSRLVVWSVSVVVFSAAFFGADRELGLLDSTVLERFGEPFNDWAVAIAGAFGALVFVVASRRIVTRRADYRKAPWSVAIPIVLTVACVVFANAPRPAKLPEALELREIAEASFPQSQTEYEKLVADARESVAPVASAPLFKTSDGSDAEAVELNDLREKFLDACELTNRRAATFVDVENAEKAFYAALRKALDDPNRRFPEPTEPNAALQFLVEIPSIRPTAERQTDNNYAFAKYGNFDSGVKSTSAKEVIARERAKNGAVWERGLWNATQVMPDRINFSLAKISGEVRQPYRDCTLPKSALKNPDEYDYNELVDALAPSPQGARNEIERRLLYMKLAAKTPRPDGDDRPWESFSAICLRGLLPKPPQTPLDPGLQPLIAQPRRPELFEPCPEPDKLVPFLDENNRPPNVPDYRDAAQAEYRETIGALDDAQTSADVDSPSPLDAFYNPDAPARVRASVPKYAPSLANAEIDSIEVSGIYPLFAKDGTPIVDSASRRFYGATFNDVDRYGEPILFSPEPTDETPNFNLGDATLLTSRDAEPSDKPQIGRVRAFLLFQPDGENSYVVPNLWAIRSFEEVDGEKIARVKYVDATGTEPLDVAGVPKYAEKRAAFIDRRRPDEPNFAYAFDIPPEHSLVVGDYSRLNYYSGRLRGSLFAKNVALKVVRKTESGDYVDFDPRDLLAINGRIYANFPAAAMATSSSLILDPSYDYGSNNERIVVVEPLEPTTFTTDDKNQNNEYHSERQGGEQ